MHLGQSLQRNTATEHEKAMTNVKKFVALFLVFDIMIVTSYGNATWNDIIADRKGSSLVQNLNGLITLAFSCDVLLGSSLLCSLISLSDGPVPKWEDAYCLILFNWRSNIISLLTLAFQRVLASSDSSALVAVALLYVAVRAMKLRPLGQLKEEVAYACEHTWEIDRYEALLRTWATKQDARTETWMARITLISVAGILVTLLIAFIYTWFFWQGSAGTKLQVLTLEEVNPFVDAGNAGVAGAGAGAGIASIFGPEAAPVGAAVGGLIGVVGGFSWAVTHG